MPEQEQKRIQRKGGDGDGGAEDAGQVTTSAPSFALSRIWTGWRTEATSTCVFQFG